MRNEPTLSPEIWTIISPVARLTFRPIAYGDDIKYTRYSGFIP